MTRARVTRARTKVARTRVEANHKLSGHKFADGVRNLDTTSVTVFSSRPTRRDVRKEPDRFLQRCQRLGASTTVFGQLLPPRLQLLMHKCSRARVHSKRDKAVSVV